MMYAIRHKETGEWAGVEVGWEGCIEHEIDAIYPVFYLDKKEAESEIRTEFSYMADQLEIVELREVEDGK